MMGDQIVWFDEMTRALIEMWGSEDVNKFMDGTKRNSEAYNIMANSLKETFPQLDDIGMPKFKRSLINKLEALRSGYNAAKDLDQPGVAKKVLLAKCKYYYEMKAILGDDLDEPHGALDQEAGYSAGSPTREGDDDGSAADFSGSNADTDQSIASPSAEDSSEANKLTADLGQSSDSRKRKRTTPNRVIIDTSTHKDEQLRSTSSGSEQAEESEVYPKGVVVVQPTAVEDELEPAEAVVSQTETAVPVSSNQRVLFAINRIPKKTPVPILPKITAVHSGFIPTVARASQPAAAPTRHAGTPYERPQNRQRQARAPPTLAPPPQQTTFDPNVLQEQQHQEEYEGKMELYRMQIELATAQLRMAEEEHRVRLAKLQVELQTAQMEHDAKAAQLTPGS